MINNSAGRVQQRHQREPPLLAPLRPGPSLDESKRQAELGAQAYQLDSLGRMHPSIARLALGMLCNQYRPRYSGISGELPGHLAVGGRQARPAAAGCSYTTNITKLGLGIPHLSAAAWALDRPHPQTRAVVQPCFSGGGMPQPASRIANPPSVVWTPAKTDHSPRSVPGEVAAHPAFCVASKALCATRELDQGTHRLKYLNRQLDGFYANSGSPIAGSRRRLT